MHAEPVQRPFRIISASDAIPFSTALPVIPLKLAAGGFSRTQLADALRKTADYVEQDGKLVEPEPGQS